MLNQLARNMTVAELEEMGRELAEICQKVMSAPVEYLVRDGQLIVTVNELH